MSIALNPFVRAKPFSVNWCVSAGAWELPSTLLLNLPHSIVYPVYGSKCTVSSATYIIMFNCLFKARCMDVQSLIPNTS